MRLRAYAWMGLLLLACVVAKSSIAGYQLFARDNLVAWCIVPFDAKKRGPEERAKMLDELGFKWLAYDYRAEHIPTFDAEIEALKKRRIQLYAWWFPTTLNEEARHILKVIQRHNVRPQLWVTGGGEPVKSPEEQKARLDAETARIGTIAREAQKAGCVVALYNHGGWFGDPTNQVAIIDRLKAEGVLNVKIVYNLHHAHHELDRFAELLDFMKPHLVCLNLNGMVPNGDKMGKKILPVGEGSEDLRVIRAIHKSGWVGRLGILNHTEEDAETRLRKNLEGLAALVSKTGGQP